MAKNKRNARRPNRINSMCTSIFIGLLRRCAWHKGIILHIPSTNEALFNAIHLFFFQRKITDGFISMCSPILQLHVMKIFIHLHIILFAFIHTNLRIIIYYHYFLLLFVRFFFSLGVVVLQCTLLFTFYFDTFFNPYIRIDAALTFCIDFNLNFCSQSNMLCINNNNKNKKN